MKCFIHKEEEAVAVCKKCGKAMCAACSSYSGHSGVCPECRRKEFEREVSRLETENKELKWSIIGSAILTIVLSWTVIFGIINGVKWYKKVQKRNKNQQRIDYLKAEIEKLIEAQNNRSTVSNI